MSRVFPVYISSSPTQPSIPLFDEAQKEEDNSPISMRKIDDEQNKVSEHITQDNEAFYEAYSSQKGLDMENWMQGFLCSTEFNPNYEGGVLFVEAALKKDKAFLKRLIKDNPDPDACKEGLVEALKASLIKEDLEMITILGKVGVDLQQIKIYSTYSLNTTVKTFTDDLLRLPEANTSILEIKASPIIDPNSFI